MILWGHPGLRSLLHDEEALCHPFVIGELACGNLRNRGEILKGGRLLSSHSESLART